MQSFTPPNTFISWKYFEADSPKKLEALLLQMQVTAGKGLNSTPPQFVNNKWTVWVLTDFSKDIAPKKKLDMKNKVKI